MSDFPPPPDPAFELSYETPQPAGNAQLLVRLAVIFLFISAGLSFLYVATRIVDFGIALAQTGSLFRLPPGAPPAFLYSMYAAQIIPSVLSLIACILKTLGAYKLLRRGRAAWGLGLTAAIVSCLEIWACGCCFIEIGAGVYSIVILCFPHVRQFLRGAAADLPQDG